MENGAVGHNFEMGLPKDYPSQIWFNLVQRFQRRRFESGLTKPGEVGDFFALVSMMSPNFCQKAKF
jgi:hypothetical protein